MTMTHKAALRRGLTCAMALAAGMACPASAIDFTQKAVVRGNGGAWGAIAVDRSTLLHGSALQMSTEEEAKAQAIKTCNQASPGGKCELVQAFSNTCMGLVLDVHRSVGTRMFWHQDNKAQIAIGTAQMTCGSAEGHNDCRPITVWCSYPDRIW